MKAIEKDWKENRKWEGPGYHYLIEPNGTVNELLNIELMANGVKGYNAESIHISYIGGVDENNVPVDNRTSEQKIAQMKLLLDLILKFPDAEIKGHRDFPGVKKACPSFDVREWLREINTNSNLI